MTDVQVFPSSSRAYPKGQLPDCNETQKDNLAYEVSVGFRYCSGSRWIEIQFPEPDALASLDCQRNNDLILWTGSSWFCYNVSNLDSTIG